MKTFTVSDEDYNTLMELSKELQTQDNNYQAFPYFWEPSSMRLTPNLHDEGEEVVFVRDGDRFDPSDIWDFEGGEISELAKDFIEQECYSHDETHMEYEDLENEIKLEWVSFIKHYCDDYDVYTEDWERVQEHNPSLFKSDVQGFIKSNSHHLGKDPHTYSRSVWRMPKMESLVGAILRLNKNHNEEVNHEALRFVNKRSK